MNTRTTSAWSAGIVVSMAVAAMTVPGTLLAGPGCMNDQRMTRNYYPYGPMGPQVAYGRSTPYGAPYGGNPGMMAAPYRWPMAAPRSYMAVTDKPAAAPVVEARAAQATPAGVNADSKPAGEQVTVRINGMRFEPENITVKPGTTVTWEQSNPMPHTITGKRNGLRSNTLLAGQKYSYTFNEAGSFAYACDFHPSMRGRVSVEASGADS
jgi:plastocyanin